MKTTLRLSILILVFGSLFGKLYAQESAFEMILPYEMDNCVLTYCCETSDGNFIVVPGSFCKMLKISPSGEIINEKTYEMEGVGGVTPWLTWISGLLDIPGDPSHHVVIAEAYDDDTDSHNRIHIFKIDDNLQFDQDSVIKVDFSKHIKHFWTGTPHRCVLDADGSISFATHAIRWDGSDCVMYARVSSEDTVTVAFDERYGFDTYDFQMCDFKWKNDHYDMTVGYRIPPYGFTGVCMYEVSNAFESDSVCRLTKNSTSESLLSYNNSDTLCCATWFARDGFTLTWLNDSTVLIPTTVSGYRRSKSGNHGNGVGIWKLDANHNLLDNVLIDVFELNNGMDEECLYAWEPLLFTGEDVYLCYMVYKGTSSSPMRTVVCKLDTELNLKWKRWYGKSGQYIITGTALTSDGGCLLTGEGNALYTPYVLKITADGYCSTKENEEPLLRPYAWYPNPVEDVLRVEYSPDITPKTVELYDLQGRLIKTQSSNLESVAMENLPAGTYTLRVLLEDGTSYSDKVVKQ